MTTLIIEPRFGGHHYTYLEKLVEGALDRNIAVVVGVGDDKQGERILSSLEASLGKSVPHVRASVPPQAGVRTSWSKLLANEVRNRRFLARAYRLAKQDHSIDRVLVPYMDWALFAIGLLGSPFENVPFSGVTMRQTFHFDSVKVPAARPRMRLVKEHLFTRLLRRPSLQRLFVLDDTLVEYFRELDAPGAEKLTYFADPSDTPLPVSQQVARERLGIPQPECCVLVYGSIDHRKGIPRLLRWLADEPTASSTYLLVAGRQAEDVKPLFSGEEARQLVAEKRLHVYDRFIEPEEESTFFSAADVVWLAYSSSDLMSSVLVKAALHRKVVLYSPRGLIGRYVDRHGSPPQDQHKHSCAVALSTPPEGLRVREFASAERIPDHSWNAALEVIYR